MWLLAACWSAAALARAHAVRETCRLPADTLQGEGLPASGVPAPATSPAARADSVEALPPDSLHIDTLALAAVTDSLLRKALPQEKPALFKPDPIRSMWLALAFPGGGQIYNRKYWKLPVIYGGYLGCAYALTWNNQMLKDYSQAYLDIMDSDPNTCSYNKFLHLGKKIDSSNEDRYKTIFKKRKDKYRRWRDMSFFCMVGVYALSVIDAYVDAELSEFDISKDLSLRVEPAVMGSGAGLRTGSASVGLQCSLRF